MEDKLTTVVIEGKTWFGILKEVDGKTVLEEAIPWTSYPFTSWIKAKNLGELATVVIGKGTGYAETPLSAVQKREFRRFLEDMEEVKRTAIARLENSYFDK